MVTRRPSVERIPPSRHAEIGTVSSSQYIDLNFPALHRSCFFQLHVHISHESTTWLYTGIRCADPNPNPTSPNLINFYLVHSLYLFPRSHRHSTIAFQVIMLTNRQTNRQTNGGENRTSAKSGDGHNSEIQERRHTTTSDT